MARRKAPPLKLSQQLGFLARLWPLIAFLPVIGLIQVWKAVESDGQRSRIYLAQRECASREGEWQQLRARYLFLTSFSRLAPRALELELRPAGREFERIAVSGDWFEVGEEIPRLPPRPREETAWAR